MSSQSSQSILLHVLKNNNKEQHKKNHEHIYVKVILLLSWEMLLFIEA